MGFSTATVIETLPLSPRLRRVSLRVDEPESLVVPPGADSAVGVYFDPTPTGEGRTYSVRRHAGDQIDLDIAVHAGGPGSRWAQATRPGDRVGLDHPRSWYRPPAGTVSQLLVTDLAGLPAAARIIEETPLTVSTTVIVEVVDHHDLDYLPTRPGLAVVPAMGTGNGFAPSRLPELIGQVDLTACDYCWFGGEAGSSREVRKYLRGHAWTVDRYDIAGYWRLDSETWDAKFALVGSDLFAVYQRAIAAGKSEKLASEEFDDALDRAGL
ncbi:siderophore-interacting protein [Mycobacterium sp. EPa45]|uniref:siderophore-interacting protein n=1 Tax=Mycobacterium sp. EPa45 TaxID=1545728 RepID=UPI00064270EF|nr:siderophore-interacting protein [Mycobacterium sp. EPa45]AKK25702.1 siderophore-interacting protein [Mycobacterium sp. EPa45]